MMSSSIDVINKIKHNAEELRSYAFSEADTIGHLIDPVLDYLGYPITQQRREGQAHQNRPDIVIWKSPEQMHLGQTATAIIEAKSLNTDLNGNGKAKQERPKEQIARYVTGYQHAGPNTFGILTNGDIWHIVLPMEHGHRTQLVSELRLLDEHPETAVNDLRELKRILQQRPETLSPYGQSAAMTAARVLTNAIADGSSPAEILRQLTDNPTYRTDLKGQVNLKGKAAHAEQAYWDAYAYTTAGKVEVEQTDLSHEALCVSVLRMKKADTEDDIAIYREDVATAASSFASTVSVNMSVVVVIQPDKLGVPVNARVAVHGRGHTGMTAEFDPYTPPPFILRSIQRLYDQLRTETPVAETDIESVVAVKEVRQEFYEAVADGWMLRQYSEAKGSVQEKLRYRESVLRHLIRTLFAWILKEEGKLPQEAFDQAFATKHAPGKYHEQILIFMFQERLNIPEYHRKRHPIAAIQSALSSTRFLNGSLFAHHEYDDAFSLTDGEYFGTEPQQPGLFTILSAYDWTASEHTPTHSDRTIDPEVLSNLFENLIAVTETPATPSRMPKGTYYTPTDVAKEMARDALMMATKDHAPNECSEEELLDLFGDSDLAEFKYPTNHLASRIENLRVFDPSVGSGAFPLSVMYAIRSALQKLGRDDADGQLTRRIISRQIHAQDINPMAVQITRLRLFIAIIAAEKNNQLPLPNLEAKIVCANTLSTVPHQGWSPIATGELQDADANIIVDALKERASIFARWQEAHDEASKERLRTADAEVRAKLKQAVGTGIAGPEASAFAEHPLLKPDAPPAQTDPRLLFYQENWQGFDIVIGNPPYEKIARGYSADKKKQFRAQLNSKGYRTIAGNDLYTLITEAGLALTKPDGGVLTLIVPLSVCFEQNKRCLRELIERNSREIRLRSQDNAPDTIFGESPVTTPANSQRNTILTVVTATGLDKPDILPPGANKWRKSERHLFLVDRRYHLLARPVTEVAPDRFDHQWNAYLLLRSPI